MSVVIITGSGGLIGSEAARYFGELGFDVVGIDNDMRRYFFGDKGSTAWNIKSLNDNLGSTYSHHEIDIRNRDEVLRLLHRYQKDIALIVHAAAQPSHDWAAKEPFTDFDINATGTLNLLEATRLSAPEAPFVFISTNKVYGDTPNKLPMVEQDTRYEITATHAYANGIAEDMSIDQCLHSIFGASKVSADILVQEYGRYFGMPTVCFRGGTLTGPTHSAVELHGFLAYVMYCTMTGKPYTVFGYQGKQVRDVLHSRDVVKACHSFFKEPRTAAVYNLGGGRDSNCSVLEAITLCQRISGRELQWSYNASNRMGDHIWWISDLTKLQRDYPDWKPEYSIEQILQEIHDRSW